MAVIDRANLILLAALEPGATVLDIGANVGAYARLYATTVGPTGYVLAVEPHPVTATTCRARCDDMPWITVQQIAVSDHGGPGALFADVVDARRSSLWIANVPYTGESYPVQVTTLDTLIGTMLAFPRLIKIDAQGAEAKILRGGTATLDARPLWQIEVWPNGLKAAGDTVEDVLEPFRSRGYVPMLHQQGALDARPAWDAVLGAAARCVRPHQAFDVVMLPGNR